MTENDLNDFFQKFSTTNSRKLSYTEWKNAATAHTSLLSEKKLEAAFNEFDRDGSGYLEHEELKKILSYGAW